MTNNKMALVLTRLEAGFRANAALLQALENDLVVTMVLARDVGTRFAPTRDWNTVWQRHWDEVAKSSRCIHDHLVRIVELAAGQDSDRLEGALVTWEAAQIEDARLLATLRVIRAQAEELEGPSRREWNQLARLMETHLEGIHTSAQALRLKLEFLKKHSAEELEKLLGTVRGHVNGPARNGQDPLGPFDRDYRNAVLELGVGHHLFAGFLDVIKALSLWVESPDERMRKKRSLTLEE